MAGPNWWQAIAAGAVAAAVANLVIFFIGRAAGASFAILDRGTLHEVSAWGVIIATVPPLVVGTGLAVLLARWWFGVIRLAQIIGAGLALLTVAGPLMTDADGATRLTRRSPSCLHPRREIPVSSHNRGMRFYRLLSAHVPGIGRCTTQVELVGDRLVLRPDATTCYT